MVTEVLRDGGSVVTEVLRDGGSVVTEVLWERGSLGRRFSGTEVPRPPSQRQVRTTELTRGGGRPLCVCHMRLHDLPRILCIIKQQSHSVSLKTKAGKTERSLKARQ